MKGPSLSLVAAARMAVRPWRLGRAQTPALSTKLPEKDWQLLRCLGVAADSKTGKTRG